MLTNILSDSRIAASGRPVRVFLATLLLIVSACQVAPPVQEMSDARQAIAVARAAGAGEFAASDLKAAEASLESAQQELMAGAYSRAHRDALRARDKALEALSIAERAEMKAK